MTPVFRTIRLFRQGYRNNLMNPRTPSTQTPAQAAADTVLPALACLPGVVYRLRLSPQRTLEFVSASSLTLLGVPSESLLNRAAALHELIHTGDRDRVLREIETAITQRKHFQVEYRIRHARGHWLSVSEQGQVAPANNGQPIALEGYITDISGRARNAQLQRAKEFESHQMRKNKSINTLASGIAHDFNNVVAGILGSAELIKMELENVPNHPSQEFLQQIFQAGERARELVHQIKTFSQRQPCDRRPIQLQPFLTESLQIIRSIIPQKVEITRRMDPKCPGVLGDAAQIQQSVLNLCTNAWLSMPDRAGHIELRLSASEVDEPTAKKNPDLVPGPYVVVSVCDDGPGLSKSSQERVFEPFAHKRTSGKKCGLELYAVHEVMQAHEGAILLESAPGQGTSFHLYFPAQI
jgi:PAS domain S-box-containing protein